MIVEPGRFATRFFENADGNRPENGELADKYVHADRLQREVWSRLPQAGDPREVAEAVADLVELPAGARPLRTTVGGARRADRLNAAAEELQRAVLERMEV